MIPYGRHDLTEQDVEAVVRTLRSDRLTQGPRVRDFEEALCESFGCDYAVAVNTGTMALRMAYRALGLEADARVVTSPITFVATANAAVHQGARPVFRDVEEGTVTLDPGDVETYLEDHEDDHDVAGLVPVHFAGHPADMESLYELARKRDLFVLEDACHAPGATWTDSSGRRRRIGSCSYSDAAVLSFHPVKHVTTGEGGAVLTNREELADRCRRLRRHGLKKTFGPGDPEVDPWYYEMQDPGFNGRITDVQCALGIEQLKRLDRYLERRRTIAARYDEAFRGLPGVTVPEERPGCEHAYHLYVLQSEWRDALYDTLREHDIQPQVHYVPVHLQPYYQRTLGTGEGDCPRAEAYYRRAISLPMFPTLSDGDVEHVIDTVRTFHERRGSSSRSPDRSASG